VEEIHHLTYERIYHEELEDLQGVCGYCHAFMHKEREDDGNAIFERSAAKARQAQAEIDRFEQHPEHYRSFFGPGRVPAGELAGLLRQCPRVIAIDVEYEIVDVRVARRKYATGVSFKERITTGPNSGCLVTTTNPDEPIYGGKLVLDLERKLWVNLDVMRWYVRSHHAV
jgi:hypothetical protein